MGSTCFCFGFNIFTARISKCLDKCLVAIKIFLCEAVTTGGSEELFS